jgi:hypothetical protein
MENIPKKDMKVWSDTNQIALENIPRSVLNALKLSVHCRDTVWAGIIRQTQIESRQKLNR